MLALACLAAVCVPRAAAQQDAALALRIPAEDKVAFHGIANFDAAGSSAGTMLYPAPNLAGALAALLTHGIIVDATARAQREKIQTQADSVLAPYRSALDGFTHRELMQQALERILTPGAKRLAENADKPAQEMMIDSAPAFAMTQDLQAVVLDNPIIVRRPGDDGKGYSVVVRIVSTPLTVENPSSYWFDEDAGALRRQTAAMFADSVNIALSAIGNLAPAAVPQRTVRYRQGKEERFERAQVLSEQCGRLLLRNLRGWLMSVPVRCEQPATSRAD
jgi:hypothetical protein